MSAQAPLIEVRGLERLYGEGTRTVRALDGVDLTVASGDYLAIMGASGSGKSTLLHLLGCLDCPTQGTYVLNGRDVSELSDKELSRVRNQRIGFVFQTFNLVPELDVIENVELPFLYSDVTSRAARRRTEQAVERVGLADRGHHVPAELSGGEMQRVAIARALAVDPLLILADEPTGNLDSQTATGILELLDELNESGTTLIVVTHDETVAAHARSRFYMRDGRLSPAVAAAGASDA